MTRLPNKIFIPPAMIESFRVYSSPDDHCYFSESLIPDSSTISEMARDFTTEGENSDLIYHCYREGLLKMKSIILNSSL